MTFQPQSLPHYWINRLGFLIRKRLQADFRRAGQQIGAEEWAVLLHLWQEDGLSAGQLAELTIRDRPAMSRLLDAMAARGLIRRDPDPADRRRLCVRLTEGGRAARGDLVPLAEALVGRSLKGVDAGDLAATLRVLRRMHDNLNAEEEDP